jgi:hypothetical protein
LFVIQTQRIIERALGRCGSESNFQGYDMLDRAKALSATIAGLALVVVFGEREYVFRG